MITIVTGIQNSGKSSYLLNWYYQNPIGFGFISKKRFLSNAHNGYDLLFLPNMDLFPLCSKINFSEITHTTPDMIKIGAYHFDQNILIRANEHIETLIKSRPNETLWIDEIGELEFQGKGFSPIMELLPNYTGDIRIGTRFSCLNKLIKHLHSQEHHILYL